MLKNRDVIRDFMAQRIELRETDSPTTYELKPFLYPGEPHNGENLVTISGAKEPLKGHFLVHLWQPQTDNVIQDVVGIVHSRKELPEEVYRCALKAGKEYAEKLGCDFVDATKRGKEGRLADRLAANLRNKF